MEKEAAGSVPTSVLPVQCILPGPIPLQTELAGVDVQRRPEPPPAPSAQLGEHVWDGDAWIWIEFRDPKQLTLTGVIPGARSRRGDDDPVDWRLLDRRLAGLAHRWGRAGTWADDGSALEILGHVRAQSWSMALAGQASLRCPEWLRDPAWMLNANEQRVVMLLLGAYERGWGGVFDCASTVATHLGMSERTLRRILNGFSWRPCRCPAALECDHPRRRRPGLVERGIVTSLETMAPPTSNERRADKGWLLLRIAGQLERVARYHVWAMDWAARPPRNCGITRRVARRVIGAVSRAARASRYAAAGRAWSARRRQPAQDAAEEREGTAHRAAQVGAEAAPAGLEEGGGQLEHVPGPCGVGVDRVDHAPEATPQGPASGGDVAGRGVSLAGGGPSVEPAAQPGGRCDSRRSDSLTDKTRDQGGLLRSPPLGLSGARRRGHPGPAKAGPPRLKRNVRRPPGCAAGSTDGPPPASDTPRPATSPPDAGGTARPQGSARGGPTPRRDCGHPRVFRGRCTTCREQVRADLSELLLEQLGTMEFCPQCGKAICDHPR